MPTLPQLPATPREHTTYAPTVPHCADSDASSQCTPNSCQFLGLCSPLARLLSLVVGRRPAERCRFLTVEFLPVGRSSRSLGSSNSSRRFLELSRTRSRTLETLEITQKSLLRLLEHKNWTRKSPKIESRDWVARVPFASGQATNWRPPAVGFDASRTRRNTTETARTTSRRLVAR